MKMPTDGDKKLARKAIVGAAARALAEPADPEVLSQLEREKYLAELDLCLARTCLRYYKTGEIRGLQNFVGMLERHTENLPMAMRDQVIGHLVREACKSGKQPPKQKGLTWDQRTIFAMVEDLASQGYPKSSKSRRSTAFDVVAKLVDKSEGQIRKQWSAGLRATRQQ